MSKESELREQLWYGVPFKTALQDVVSRHATGYKYDELKEIVGDPNNEDGLDESEISNVDQQVNVLAHLFVFYHSHQTDEGN